MDTKKENKHYIKIGIVYTLLTIILLVLIYFLGVSAAVTISELLQKKSPALVSSTNLIVPPPQLSSIPEATNSAALKVWGFAPANYDVDIYLNDSLAKTVSADSEGKFEGFIDLVLGINKIFAQTKTKEQTSSLPSKILTISFNDISPSLEILEPKETLVTTKSNKTIIKGKVEKTSKVFINDHLTIVDQNGLFSYPVTLQSGENKIKIVCLDNAQNKTEKEITFELQP